MQGFSKVTMDDIARDLGMSKKTLYKFFPDKRTLLHQVVELSLVDLRTGLESRLRDSSKPFPVRLQGILTFVGQNMASIMNRAFLQDLQRFAPEEWQHIEEFRDKMIMTRFRRLIEQGVTAGYFHDGLDCQMVVLIYLSAIHNIINPEVLADLPFTSKQVFESIVRILLYGILTDEARARIEGDQSEDS